MRRSREDIEKSMQDCRGAFNYKYFTVQMEVLLDIRDELIKLNEVEITGVPAEPSPPTEHGVRKWTSIK